MTFEFPERTRQPPVMRYADTQLAFEATRHRSRVSENWPALDSLVTEDDEPVDNIFSEKQQRLLTNSLYNSWQGPQLGRTFLTLANVGLFYAPHKPPLVPDVLVSLDVKMPDDVWHKQNRSYFVSTYGKPPEVVIEIVSNRQGKESGTKLPDYARAKVRYYVIFDPEEQLKQGVLRVYELRGSTYVEKNDGWLSGVNLGLTLWEGWYEDKHDVWLRWCDQNGQLILTGSETTEEEHQRAEQERAEKQKALELAEQERQRAEQEHQRAERFAAQLRALGIDPQSV